MGTKSKVVSSKLIDTWPAQDGGNMCTFEIEFEDGTKGNYYISEQYKGKMPFTVGREVEYTSSKNQKGDVKIKYVKPPQKGRSSYNDPVAVRKTAMSVAQSAAIDALIHIDQLSVSYARSTAEYFFKWIVKVAEDRDTVSIRWNKVLDAVKMMPAYITVKVSEPDDINQELAKVLKNAEEFYNQVQAVT